MIGGIAAKRCAIGAEIFYLVRGTPRNSTDYSSRTLATLECSVSDTARNFLTGCAEAAATAWIGLPQIDHFAGHAGHDGVMLELPRYAAEPLRCRCLPSPSCV